VSVQTAVTLLPEPSDDALHQIASARSLYGGVTGL
jgi:hypothetical protein